MGDHNIESHCSKQPIVIDDNLSIRDALELMRVWGVRHFPVMNGDKTVGIISERDIATGFEPATARSFTVPYTANLPISPPLKNNGLTT